MKPFEIWNKYMQSYDFLTSVDGYARNLQDIVEALKPQPGMSVLDAGSGTGNLSLELSKKGADVTSCDFSPSAIAKHLEKDSKAHVVQASLEEPLPFNNDHFSAVCCASVLFALSRQGCKLALEEFHRVLNHTGKIVLTVPAQEARLRSLVFMHMTTLMRRHGTVGGGFRAIRHVPSLIKVLHYNRLLMNLPDWQGFHIFSEPELRSCFTDAGFSRIAVTRTYGGCFFLVTAQKNDDEK